MTRKYEGDRRRDRRDCGCSCPLVSALESGNGGRTEACAWFCIEKGDGGPWTPGMHGPSTSIWPSDLTIDGGDGTGRPREGDARSILPTGYYGRKRITFSFSKKKNTHNAILLLGRALPRYQVSASLKACSFWSGTKEI